MVSFGKRTGTIFVDPLAAWYAWIILKVDSFNKNFPNLLNQKLNKVIKYKIYREHEDRRTDDSKQRTMTGFFFFLFFFSEGNLIFDIIFINFMKKLEMFI